MTLSRAFSSLLAACAFSLLVGCGGATPETSAPGGESSPSTEASDVQAQAVCTARCQGGSSVSCSGNTCQSVDYQSVTCDGRRTNCPAPCTVTTYCESLGGSLSCSGTTCQVLGPQSDKVCGGVSCDGVAQYCPPLPGDLACY